MRVTVTWVAAWVAALGATLMLACGPSASYRRASQAELAGNYYEAVRSYRAALDEDPEDEDAIAGLERSEHALVGQTAAAVDGSLAAYDYPTALDQIAPGLELLPEDRTLLVRLDNIRTGGLGFYEHELIAGHLRQAFEGADVLAVSFPHDPESTSLAERARTAYASRVEERASDAEEQGKTGLALALWTVHRGLTGSRATAVRTMVLRDVLVEQTAFRYHVRYEGLLRDWPTATIAQPLAELTTDPEEARVAIRALLDVPVFQEAYASGLASADYVAGYRDVPNPEYDACSADISRQERRTLQAEGDLLRNEEDAHAALVARDHHQGEADYDLYYSRWDSAERQAQQSREALLQERQRLHDLNDRLIGIPPMIEEEIWDTYTYEVRDFTLRARGELTVEVNRRDIGHVGATYHGLEAASQDTWHDAHPTIQLPEDPLDYPLDETALAAEIQNGAVAVVSDTLEVEFEGYRRSIENDGLAMVGTHPDDAADQLVRAALLEPDRLTEEAALWLDEYTGLQNPHFLR